jgi:hypothetical protein
LAESSAELSLLFMAIVLVTGPIWARTSWGTWWVWEARITSTLFLWLLVLGYLVLRGAVESAEGRARLSAVMGSLAALLSMTLMGLLLFYGMELLDDRVVFWRREARMSAVSRAKARAWMARRGQRDEKKNMGGETT